MEKSTRKAPFRLQSQGAPNEKLFKSGISHRHYTTRRRRIKVTFTKDFWGIMAIIAVSILMPVLHMLLCMWGGVA